MRDIREEILSLGAEIGLFIFEESAYLNEQNKSQPMFIMEKKGWLQMGAKYDAKTRYAIIDYAEKLENSITTPKSFSDALYLAAEQQKTIEALQVETVTQKTIIENTTAIMKENESKVVFADTVSGSNNLILIRQFAKLLSTNGFEIGQNRLYEWFRENKYLSRNNEPYQNYVAMGLLIPLLVGQPVVSPNKDNTNY